MTAAIVAFLIRLLCGPVVRQLAPLEGGQQRVFFANHSSHLDFLVIWATLPAEVRRMTRPVAARDYWEAGRIRRFIASTFFRGVLIERGRRDGGDNPIEQMLEVLDRDQSLIIFPEGTRGPGEEVAPFRAGLFLLAEARPDVDLAPVHLENLNRILPKGEFLPVPLLSYITFGRPLQRVDGETKDAFLARARQAVISLEERP